MNSKASKAGIKIGDIIEKLNDEYDLNFLKIKNNNSILLNVQQLLQNTSKKLIKLQINR